MKASKHMLKQRERSGSLDCTEYSLYHGPNGLMCPGGMFISPEDADLVEGLPVNDPDVLAVLTVVPTPGVVKVLKALQDVHDDAPVEAWNGRIKGLARKFKFDAGAKSMPKKKKSRRR
jgi:hypothetical protein